MDLLRIILLIFLKTIKENPFPPPFSKSKGHRAKSREQKVGNDPLTPALSHAGERGSSGKSREQRAWGMRSRKRIKPGFPLPD